MKSPVLLVIGVVGILVGMAFIMPAIAQLRTTGALPGVGVALLFLGVALTGGGAAAMAYGVRRVRTQ